MSAEIAGSFVRLLGGLCFVLAIFFGGVWLYKNWSRACRVRSRSKLRVIEAQSLGPRQALYVIGYEQQRFLVGACPTGIALVSALPQAAAEEKTEEAKAPNATFALLLQNALGRK